MLGKEIFSALCLKRLKKCITYWEPGRVVTVGGTGSDIRGAADLEMRAVAPIWECGAARAAAYRAVLCELSTSRRSSYSIGSALEPAELPPRSFHRAWPVLSCAAVWAPPQHFINFGLAEVRESLRAHASRQYQAQPIWRTARAIRAPMSTWHCTM